MDLRLVAHPDDPDTVTHGDPHCDRWQGFGHKPFYGDKKWTPKEAREWWAKFRITRNRVDVAFRRSRCRSLETLADEGFEILCQYDDCIRTGEGDAHALRCALDDLCEEANGGTSFGVAVNRRPERLRALWKWKARAAGRLPMFGLRQRFRFECRGMHVVACTRYGLGLHLDPDKHRYGDLCWSSTGYRSFTGETPSEDHRGSPVDWARAVLESYIDQPKGKDGMGGLGGWADRPWLPTEATCWRDRAKGKEWPEHIAEHYGRLADQAQRRFDEWGLDPYTVFTELAPPKGQIAFAF